MNIISADMCLTKTLDYAFLTNINIADAVVAVEVSIKQDKNKKNDFEKVYIFSYYDSDWEYITYVHVFEK